MRASRGAHRRSILAAGLLLSAGAAVAEAAGAAPAGFKVVKDRKGNCQMEVPSSWKGLISTAGPEDRQAMAAIHLLPGKDWAESKAMAEHVMAPRQIVEDTPERFWFVYPLRANRNPADAEVPATPPRQAQSPATPAPAEGRPAEVGWYVSVPGPLGPCAAQITFKNDDLAEIARDIALSVTAVAPRP